MIVVGGKESANTVRLAELAAATGTPTFHVEKAEELDYEKLRGKKTIGVTAGASTPNWMIAEVTERLQELARRDWPRARRGAFALLSFLLDTNLFLAAGALAMGYGCAVMTAARYPPAALAAAAIYIFAMYAVSIQAQSRTERYSNPLRWRFYERWGAALVRVGFLGLGIALAISAFLGVWAFCLMLLAASAGVIYRLELIPKRWAPAFRYRRLIDIPGSKDIFMALAWAAVLTVYPLLGAARANGAGPPFDDLRHHLIRVGITFFFVFTLVLIRSVVFDLRDIQGDQIMGRETIPMVLGKEPTKAALAALTGLLLAGMLGAALSGALQSIGYVMMIPLLYTWGYLYLYHRRVIARGVLFETILGGKFLLVGILAGLWVLLRM
jgi:4-hydroxy-3-methylbut-2-enyl diphosphate reductase